MILTDTIIGTEIDSSVVGKFLGRSNSNGWIIERT